MQREVAEEICQALAVASSTLDEAVADVIRAGGSSEEVAACRAIIAPVMASLFIDAARPLTLEYPALERAFTGLTPEGTQ